MNSLLHIFEEGNKSLVENAFKNFDKILIKQKQLDNEEFFNTLITNFNKVEESYFNMKDWRIQKIFLVGLYNILEYLSLNFSYGEFDYTLVNFIKKNLNFENYQIQIETVQLMALKLRYSRNKDTIFKIIDYYFFHSSSFYSKRLFFTFFSKCLEIFSFSFIFENGILEKLLKFLDSSEIYICKVVALLKEFYPLIEDNRTKFIILNKLELLRKNLKEGQLKDLELIKV